MSHGVAVAQAPRKPFLRLVRRAAKRVVPFALALYFIPQVLIGYLALGFVDVARNKPLTWPTAERYFTGNGVLTWLLSPFNLLMDLLALPYVNKGVYTLADLPEGHQQEIKTLIDAAHHRNLIGMLDAKLGDNKRGMIFFKWYGKNIPVSVDVPEFHREYRHIRSIGVSIFNKKASTGLHYGPLRVTFRVLYNINRLDDPNVFIEVGNHTHRWRDEQLFIFDDTLQHRSVNESDAVRYCLFVDILRPSAMPWLMRGVLVGIGLLLSPFKAMFYKHWTFLT
jgi:beta-hydroxylase